MWSDILIGSNNSYLKNANIHYDCCKHEYDNACDDTCNECGYHRTVNGHVYDNACDDTCNECGYIREVPDHIYGENDICINCGHYKFIGDADRDGEITVTDALMALRVAAKLAEPTPELLATCDIDKDGVITVTDALAILRVAAKLADSL